MNDDNERRGRRPLSLDLLARARQRSVASRRSIDVYAQGQAWLMARERSLPLVAGDSGDPAAPILQEARQLTRMLELAAHRHALAMAADAELVRLLTQPPGSPCASDPDVIDVIARRVG